MKRIFTLCLMAIVVTLIFTIDSFAVTYQYNANNEGWQQSYIGRPPSGPNYDTLFSRSSADWEGVNGNPAGNIYQDANGIDQRAYWMGLISDNFLGDLTGKTLKTDIFSTNNWQTIASGSYGDDGNVYARWVISNQDGDNYNMFVSNRDASIDINNLLNGWETHSVFLTENNFSRWSNKAANSQSFSEVLRDYSSIGLYIFSGTDDVANTNGGTGTWGNGRLLHYGAYSSDGYTATWRLDNFQAVPIPGAIWLLGSGLLGFVGIKRRKTS